MDDGEKDGIHSIKVNPYCGLKCKIMSHVIFAGSRNEEIIRVVILCKSLRLHFSWAAVVVIGVDFIAASVGSIFGINSASLTTQLLTYFHLLSCL